MGEWSAGTGALGRILYRDGQAVGMVDTPEIAAEIVDGLNRRWLPGLAAAAGAQVCTCPGVDGVHVIGVGGCAPESGRERSLSLPPGVEVRREDRGGTVIAVSEQVVFCALCPDPPWPSQEFHPVGRPEHREAGLERSPGGCRHCGRTSHGMACPVLLEQSRDSEGRFA